MSITRFWSISHYNTAHSKDSNMKVQPSDRTSKPKRKTKSKSPSAIQTIPHQALKGMINESAFTGYRSRIAARNLMEGDEFIMAGEPNIYVTKIVRNEAKGTIQVTFTNDMKRKYKWSAFAVISETPQRHLYRRNQLRRNGYMNYFNYLYT